VDDILHRGGDDAAASGGTGDQIECPIGSGHDCRGTGRERALARSDVVRRGRNEAKGVGGSGDRKVCSNSMRRTDCFWQGKMRTIHFVIHNDSCLRDHDLTAEQEVDSRDDGDRETGVVRCCDVGSSRAKAQC
jgi:hypothetical protein